MEPCIPLPLDQDVLDDIVDKAKDWALLHGVGMRYRDNFSKDSITFAPFLLLPSPFPRKEFEKTLRIQTILNEMVHKVAHDYEFLRHSLSNTCKVDEFTRRLFQIYETVRSEGLAQNVSLGLIRSDLMLERECEKCSTCNKLHVAVKAPYCCWRQVEVNTIASGFGWLGPVSSKLHSYILSELGHSDKLNNLPENRALEGLCGGMLKAWEVYDNCRAVILFVVENVTYNICDQRFHEFQIKKMNPEVRVIRKTLTEIGERGMLDSTKRMKIDGDEIAVIYFRSGYVPDQYFSEVEWDARLMMERSLAIKCPSIHYHLAGCKKVQQELARPGVVERYISTPEDSAAIKGIFTGLYSLDKDEIGDRAVEMALANPENYVMKPQREGGGNNVYGKDIKEFLTSIKDSDERTGWILMDRINPPLLKNYMIRPKLKGPIFTEMLCELGIFGVVIGDANKIIVNEVAGHMLRTKVSSANEGGVATGMGALDSVFLCDFDEQA